MGISSKQLEQLQQRLAGQDHSVSQVTTAGPPPPASDPPLILGIDPSLRATGYGMILADRERTTLITQGTIKCPSGWARSQCLAKIYQAIKQIALAHRPDRCAVEGLFYAQNLKTALIMGEARGAAIVAVAELGVDLFEIAPRKVKQAIVGYGGAQKAAVAKMVQTRLNYLEPLDPDAADALALALALAQEGPQAIGKRAKPL